MAPAEFSLRLQYGKSESRCNHRRVWRSWTCLGITGGFAPPTPSAIYTVTKSSPQNQLYVSSAIRADGTAHLQDAIARPLVYHAGDTAKLLDEVYDILKTLPMEKPIGSEDIYGLDASIAWGSDDLMWINGGPQGCGGGTSTVQPTEEQKAKFKRAVDILQVLIQRANAPPEQQEQES